MNTPINSGIFQSDLDAAGFKLIGLHLPSASSDAATKGYVDAHSGGGGGAASRKFDVMTYGAVGDGTADDTGAIQAALAAIPSTGGVLYFPPGQYKYAGSPLLIDRQITVEGDGSGVQFVSPGPPIADVWGQRAITTIDFNSSTGTLFNVTAHGCAFINLLLRNTSSTTPSAGAGILISSGGDRTNFVNVGVDSFYIDIDVQAGSALTFEDCWIVGPVLYGLKLRNVSIPDGGDHFISNCYFCTTAAHGATSAIRVESGGGVKIIDTKINCDPGTNFVNGIDLAVADGIGTTSDLLVSNCSIENCSAYGIKGTIGSSTWYNILITGNQFNPTGISFSAASSGGFNGVSLVGNVLLKFGGTGTAISLTNCTNVMFGGNAQIGYADLLATTTCTFVPTYIGSDARLVSITGGVKLQARNPGTNTWVDADQWTNP